MTWSYNPVLLTSTSSTELRQVMKVRLLVGDTDSDNQQIQNEEIAFILQNQSAVNYAAADCADILAAKYSYLVTTQNSELKITASQRQDQYAALAKRLRSGGPGDTPSGPSAGVVLAAGYAGGISVTDNETYTTDTDNVLPSFKIGQDDHPSVSDRSE
jgi:hypothetical protein